MRAVRERRWLIVWLGLLAAGTLATTLTAAGCGHTTHTPQQHSRFYGKTSLRIGSHADQPGVGLYNPTTYQWSGIDVSVANYLLTALHIPHSQTDPHIYPVTVGDRDPHLLHGIDDLIVATYSITDARIREGITFTIPYLFSYQDILIRTTDTAAIKTVADLRGHRVCTGPTVSTPYQHLLTLNQGSPPLGAILDPQPSNALCVERLLAHQADAVVTDSAVLYGFQAAHPTELHLVGTKVWPRPEHYGVGFIAHSPTDATELNTAIQHMITDGTWRKAIITSFCPGAQPTDPPCRIARVFIDNPPSAK